MSNEEFDRSVREKLHTVDDKPMSLAWDPEELWLSVHQQKRIGRRYYRLKIVSMAAALLMGVSIYFLYTQGKEKVTIRYREEIVTNKSSVESIPDYTNTFQSLLDEHCRNNAPVCQTPQFKELKGQLEELELHSNELRQQMLRFGNDQDLVEAHDRIQRVRTEVEKELIDLASDEKDK